MLAPVGLGSRSSVIAMMFCTAQWWCYVTEMTVGCDAYGLTRMVLQGSLER